MHAHGWSGDVEVEQVAVALDEDAVGAGDGDLLVGGLGDGGGVELGALALGAADRAVGAVDGALHKLEGVAREAASMPARRPRYQTETVVGSRSSSRYSLVWTLVQPWRTAC